MTAHNNASRADPALAVDKGAEPQAERLPSRSIPDSALTPPSSSPVREAEEGATAHCKWCGGAAKEIPRSKGYQLPGRTLACQSHECTEYGIAGPSYAFNAGAPPTRLCWEPIPFVTDPSAISGPAPGALRCAHPFPCPEHPSVVPLAERGEPTTLCVRCQLPFADDWETRFYNGEVGPFHMTCPTAERGEERETGDSPISERERWNLMEWATSPADVKGKRIVSATTYARTIRRYEAALRQSEAARRELVEGNARSASAFNRRLNETLDAVGAEPDADLSVRIASLTARRAAGADTERAATTVANLAHDWLRDGRITVEEYQQLKGPQRAGDAARASRPDTAVER
jgi:hypothetical protein